MYIFLFIDKNNTKIFYKGASFMNKKLYYTICSSVIGSFLIVWLISFSIFSIKSKAIQHNTENMQRNKTNDSYFAQNLSSGQTSTIEEHYLIVCENKNIIVYHISENGIKTFYDKLDIDTSQMRKADRDAFIQGVTVKDKIELAHIIEDYTS